MILSVLTYFKRMTRVSSVWELEDEAREIMWDIRDNVKVSIF